MDAENDIVGKIRQALGIGVGLRYKGSSQGYGSGYPTLEELEAQFKTKIESKR